MGDADGGQLQSQWQAVEALAHGGHRGWISVREGKFGIGRLGPFDEEAYGGERRKPMMDR